MNWIHLHRLLTVGLLIAVVIFASMAFATQATVNRQKKTITHQRAELDLLFAAADSQGRVNVAFLKALKSVVARDKRVTARYLAGR